MNPEDGKSAEFLLIYLAASYKRRGNFLKQRCLVISLQVPANFCCTKKILYVIHSRGLLCFKCNCSLLTFYIENSLWNVAFRK